jgi:phosphotriesterase-related protein
MGGEGVAQVNTVLGSIDTAQLGFTLMHEHIVLQSTGLKENWPEAFDRERAITFSVERLKEAKAAGVDTIVDLTTMDNGRDTPLVEEIVKQVGIQVIVATGLWRLIPRYFSDKSPDVAAKLFVRDITEGMQGTSIKAAIIKNASDDRTVAGPQDLAFRAAARAHRQTGVPISTHTDTGNQSGLDQQRIYAEEGVDLTRVIIGHSGDTEDLDYLKKLLDRGSYLGMDRFGLDHFGPLKLLDTPRRVRVIAELCKQGYADRLVLSHDASGYPDGRDPDWQAQNWPDWRFTHVPNEVVPALLEAGVSQTQVDQMTHHTPRAIFERQGAY